MNIETSSINRTSKSETKVSQKSNQEPSVKFSEELNELKETKKNEENSEQEKPVDSSPKTEENQFETDNKSISQQKDLNLEDSLKEKTPQPNNDLKLNNAVEGLESIVSQFNKKDLNQSEDKKEFLIKNDKDSADNKPMINNDFNIQDNKDLLPQMNPNMNFSGDGQPFSSFMNNEQNQNQQQKHIDSTTQDLAEEAAILSTMAENIALANKNTILKDSDKTVTREDGIKKINTHTGITTETIVKFDSVVMNEADVEVFTNLVQNGEVNLNNLSPQAAEKAVKVSKTLADMLAKSMENNQPVRIDFDNNISVIIRVSRDGKISADFLPSSQVAEAYLKENLPLLRQRFDDNNIKYDELNHRERREQDRNNNNRKKGNRDE